MEPHAVIDELIASRLRGRGGAFFPTGRKWAFIPKPDQNPNPHYLVVNADESEPGSFKDNEIMARVPHRFFEGCLITAHAVESQARLRLHPRRVHRPVRGARRRAGRAPRPPEILGDVTIVVHRGAGRVHLRRGDRAARVARGQARPAAHEAAFPRDPGPRQVADGREQRRDDGDRRRRSSRSAVPSTRSAASPTRAARVSSPSPATSCGRGTTRSRTASACVR